MPGQSHSKKKIPAFSSARPRLTLATQTDALAFAHTTGNFNLVRFHFVRTASPQRHGPCRTVQRFLEGNHNVRFYVGSALGCRSASAESAECRTAAPAAKKCFEEVAESGSAELELDPAAAITTPLIKPTAWLLSFPLRRRLETARPVPIGAELIVFLSLFRIAENLVRLVDLLKFFLGGLFVLGHVRVILARELAKSAANLILARRFRHPECLVIISKLDGH